MSEIRQGKATAGRRQSTFCNFVLFTSALPFWDTTSMIGAIHCSAAAAVFGRNVAAKRTLAPVFSQRQLSFHTETSRRRGAVIVRAAAEPMSTVKTIVQGLHMQITPAIREYAESKVNKVSQIDSLWLWVWASCCTPTISMIILSKIPCSAGSPQFRKRRQGGRRQAFRHR